MRKFIIAAALAALPGCVTSDEPRGGAPMPLINALGAPIGSVRAWQTPGGVTFRIEASGLPHGIHGLHVHAIGRCDPPDFASAGPHWNPAGKKHGMNNPAGPHAGDLAQRRSRRQRSPWRDRDPARSLAVRPARRARRADRRRRRGAGAPRQGRRLRHRPERQQRAAHRLRRNPPARRNALAPRRRFRPSGGSCCCCGRCGCR